MKKKGRSPELLVALVLLGVFLIISLLFVYPAVRDLLLGQAKKGQCNWDFLLSAGVGAIPMAERTPEECEADRINIDNAMLEKQTELYGNKGIEKYYKNRNNLATEYFIDPDRPEEYALDRIMAKSLVDCWDKVWHGAMSEYVLKGGWFTSETYCVICSRIYFEQDLPFGKFNLKNGYITSLDAWLKTNNHQGKTYYDYLAEGQTYEPNPNQYIYSPQIPYAAVYWMYAPSKTTKLIAYVRDSPVLSAIATAVAVGAMIFPPTTFIGIIVVATAATTTGTYVGAHAGTVISQAALSTAVELGQSTGAVLLTPYDKNLRKPYAEGGLGCEQFID